MHPLQIDARLVQGAVYSKGPKQVACCLEWHGWSWRVLQLCRSCCWWSCHFCRSDNARFQKGMILSPPYWLEEFVIRFWLSSNVCWKRVGLSGETRKKLLPRMSTLCSRGVCLWPARVSEMSRGASYGTNPKCSGHRTIFLSKRIDRSGMLDIDAHDSCHGTCWKRLLEHAQIRHFNIYVDNYSGPRKKWLVSVLGCVPKFSIPS